MTISIILEILVGEDVEAGGSARLLKNHSYKFSQVECNMPLL
jgi:hypothetical protein